MEDCIFCRIAAGDIPAQVVYQDDDVVAFRDTNPQAPVHVLVIPREHVPGPLALGDDYAALAGKLVAAAAQVARQEDIADTGYRLVMNEGRQAQQSVFHVHLHVLGGRAMHWPPG
ncbi:histidine triad nucleotide-binding protein [Aggregatilinea lenta]|uniref:histidine triad nucleotide-binding protein n=1 Tax=Aggregatilinea lenta TaxID=913108 RepID=UPI000E5A6048|nr:histidine triad nucleotide-binding protein [Aggregatilinea lenta]